MPLHRDARHDRRRRLLREVGDIEPNESVSGNTGATRRSKLASSAETPTQRRCAQYSQDVRGACGQRLVQLIPVRRRSMAAIMFASVLIPVLLMYAHYMVYVSGQWPWYDHPLAVCLDASHPRGLAVWFSSHLWLLCLGTTVLTFQLRRHKLDDYRGEYRIWFWLVITCLAGNLDATTQVSDLFAAAMDGWCRTTLGWSGPAVFRSVVVVLVGLLGLRMCSELKIVPLSLCLLLVGLTSWLASVALAREELKLELSNQFRIWLRSGLWLAGLTAIWLSGLTYLRHVYIEAQRRFLLRGKLASSAMAIPLADRVRGAWQALPPLPRLKRDEPEGIKAEPLRPAQRKRAATIVEPTENNDKRGADAGNPSNEDAANVTQQKRGWGWLRAPKDQDEEAEFRKISRREQRTEAAEPETSPTNAARNHRTVEPGEDADDATPRRWLPRIPVPKLGKLPKPSMPRVSLPRVGMPKLKGPKLKLPKLKLPKFNLSGLRLNPPDAADEATQPGQSGPSGSTHTAGIKPVDTRRPLPGTSKSNQPTPPAAQRAGTAQSAPNARQTPDYDLASDDDQDLPQAMSKAERKRLRRQQQQQNRAA